MTEKMQRTTIMLPETLYERVRRLAEERGESMGQLIRDALEDTAGGYQPRMHSLGIGSSGRSDISERIDELYQPEL